MRYLIEYDATGTAQYWVVDLADDVNHAIEQFRDAEPTAAIYNIFQLIKVAY